MSSKVIFKNVSLSKKPEEALRALGESRPGGVVAQGRSVGHSCRPRVKRGAQYPRFDFPEDAPGLCWSSPLRVDGGCHSLAWNNNGVCRRTAAGGRGPGFSLGEK